MFLLAGAVMLAVIYLLATQTAGSTQVVRLPNNATLIFHAGSGEGGVPPPFFGALTRLPPSTRALPSAKLVSPPTKFELPGYLPLENVRAKLRAAVATERTNEHSRLLLWSGVAFGLMALVSGALGWLMAGRVLRPLRTMTARARRISDDNLHERLALGGPDDELKELGDTFDAMLGRLESAFEAQRRFVANASHELRTPLTLERTMIEVALADPHADVDSLRRACAGALAAGEQQEQLIEGLLTLARGQRGQRGLELNEQLDLATIAEHVLDARQDEAQAHGVRIESDLPTACTTGDGRLVERLVANLVENAIRHNIPGGWARIHTGISVGRPTLTVSNSGPEIASAELDVLLEPFRRAGTDRAGHRNGHGLGLSIVAAVASAHGATLSTRARVGGGLEVTVDF